MMFMQVQVDYQQVIDLVSQLSESQQDELMARILISRSEKRPLTPEEKIRLLETIQVDNEVLEEPSVRREDWYGDDGR
jgi:Trp operon repressor